MSTAIDLVKNHVDKSLITVKTEELVSHAIERMRKFQISQIPVVDSEGFVGSVDESALFATFLEDKNMGDTQIREIMNAPFPIVSANTSLDEIAGLIKNNNPAVLVTLENGGHHIITKYDVISHIK